VCSFKMFHGMVLLLTSLAALFFLVAAVRFLPVTGDNMHPEAANVVIADRWAHGSPLYADYRQAPYLLTAFPPLWYGALALAVKAGVSGVDALTLFGRVLSLTSLVGVAILGYRWHRRLGLTPGLALLTPTSLLAFPVLLPWAVTARPDFPMLFFGVLALWLAGLGAGATAIVPAAGAAAAAFLVRHSSVSVPAAIVLGSCGRTAGGMPRSSARPGASSSSPRSWSSTSTAAGSCGSTCRVLNSATSLHATRTRSCSSWITPPGNGFALGLLAFGLFGFLYAWRGDRRTRLLGFYFGTSLIFTVLGTTRAGANVNHYLEPGLAWAMLLPVGMDALRPTWRAGSASSTLVCVVVVVLLLPALDLQRWNMLGAQPPDFRRLADLVRDRRVFTDVPYVGARSRSPELLDSVPHAYMEKAQAWDPVPPVEALDARAYELVILQRPIDDARLATARYPTRRSQDPERDRQELRVLLRVGDAVRLRSGYGSAREGRSGRVPGSPEVIWYAPACRVTTCH